MSVEGSDNVHEIIIKQFQHKAVHRLEQIKAVSPDRKRNND
jgi:hypothetical protein